MPWTPKDALNNPAVEYPMQLVGEYKFRLKGILTEITIRLYKPFSSDGVEFQQSHFIKTPLQGTEYRTSRPSNSDEGSALHQVVHGLTSHYEAAVRAGHAPSEEWLVPN